MVFALLSIIALKQAKQAGHLGSVSLGSFARRPLAIRTGRAGGFRAWRPARR
ncbi:MAG: hypothetical protein MZW92_60880 [Comamonadaceae bacterium]|nr:hypothetical protein [Comamonadaceae bacterium]